MWQMKRRFESVCEWRKAWKVYGKRTNALKVYEWEKKAWKVYGEWENAWKCTSEKNLESICKWENAWKVYGQWENPWKYTTSEKTLGKCTTNEKQLESACTTSEKTLGKYTSENTLGKWGEWEKAWKWSTSEKKLEGVRRVRNSMKGVQPVRKSSWKWSVSITIAESMNGASRHYANNQTGIQKESRDSVRNPCCWSA